MKLGVALSQTDPQHTTPTVVRDLAQAAETIGFEHLAVYD